jgi:TonB family protein
MLTTPMGLGALASLVGHAAVFVAMSSQYTPQIDAPIFGVQQSDAAFTVSLAFDTQDVEKPSARREPEMAEVSTASVVVREKSQKKKVEQRAAAQREAGAGSSASEGDANSTTRHAAPAYASNPPPAYPESARRARQEGVAKLLVTVDVSGEAVGVKVLESSGSPALDEAAVTAVERWTFRPGTVNGHAVETSVEVPIRFSLSSGETTRG